MAAGPALVVVGAASRDVDPSDPRGWRLGGGVSYTALTAARLGLATAALIGLDALAEHAHELDLLRAAGVELMPVRLAHGPVFVNVERPEGRIQECVERSDPIPVAALPAAWRDAPGWVLAPVAGELPDGWAVVPSEGATVAVGWQGLLRELVPGRQVRQGPPRPSPILARADIVGVSRDDLDPSIKLADLCRLLRPGARLSVTRGDRGGLVMEVAADGPRQLRRYPAIQGGEAVDPTGAGDVFLAALAAARTEPRLVGGRFDVAFDVLLAATAASFVGEAYGLAGVPDRSAVRSRMREALAGIAPSLGHDPGEAVRRLE